MCDNLTKIGTIRKLYLNQIMQHIVMSVSFETVNTAYSYSTFKDGSWKP